MGYVKNVNTKEVSGTHVTANRRPGCAIPLDTFGARVRQEVLPEEFC